jgi:hypothetical protein
VSPDPDVLSGFAADFASLAPAVTQAEVRMVFRGFPAFSPDGRFIVGPVPGLRGFVRARACNAHGVSGSAGLAQHVLESLQPDPSPYVRSLSPGGSSRAPGTGSPTAIRPSRSTRTTTPCRRAAAPATNSLIHRPGGHLKACPRDCDTGLDATSPTGWRITSSRRAGPGTAAVPASHSSMYLIAAVSPGLTAGTQPPGRSRRAPAYRLPCLPGAPPSQQPGQAPAVVAVAWRHPEFGGIGENQHANNRRNGIPRHLAALLLR